VDLRKGDQFKDSEGDNWTIKNAYTREIEAATDHKYYQNALANTIDNIMHLRAASRAIHAIEQLRATPEWSAYTEHTGHGPGAGIGDNGGPPMIEEPVDKSNWKYPQMPLFRNDLMDPKLANLLDDFWGNREADGVANTLMKINDAAIGSMFLTPFPHTHNAAVHFWLQRSWDNFTPSGLKSLAVNGGRAMAEVWNQGPIYQELQRRGSGLLYGKIANRDFYADMLERTGTTLAPEETSAIEKIMGWGPGGLVQSLAYASAKGLWLSSDIMMVTRVMEEMNTHGLTMDAAIAKTERFMPNYRIPSEMLGSRAVQQTVMSRLTFMFQRYHYGMLKGIANMVNDTFRGTAEQKMHVAGSMLSAGILMMVMYPAVNDLLKKLTGTDLHIGPAGPLRLAEPLVSAGVKATSSLWSKETKDYYKDSPGFLGALSNTLSAAPVSKTLIETGLNRYNFSGRNVVEPADLAHGRTRRIIGQTAEHLAQNAVAPYSILRNITKNGESAASALTKFTFGLSEHTNDAEMRKQKALNWQERSANRRATKGGLGPIEKFFGDK
jgi:hypothetical protein